MTPLRDETTIKTLFILGAGASRASGAPLLSDFIAKAEWIRKRKKMN